ncbi:MAG: hypothetical protein WBD95_26245 [Xanthobacteraceae bacterium]
MLNHRTKIRKAKNEIERQQKTDETKYHDCEQIGICNHRNEPRPGTLDSLISAARVEECICASHGYLHAQRCTSSLRRTAAGDVTRQHALMFFRRVALRASFAGLRRQDFPTYR